jgi:riboflavin synthase
MFTGIVEALGTVRDVMAERPGARLRVAVDWAGGCAAGDSVAVNGVCLTAVAVRDADLEFQIGPETLARTNLAELRAGDRVNLERSLLPTTRLSGHFVLGHVDGVARIAERRREADWEWVDFIAPQELTEQMVPKGSVALDGISLTLVTVSPGRFGVMLIPYTLQHTTLGLKTAGATVNVETDILGKYALRVVKAATGQN